MIKRILVPIDFSPPSLQALDYAVEFARPRNAQLVLLHVVETIDFAGMYSAYVVGYDTSTIYREMECAAREQLSRLADGVRTRRVKVRISHAVGTPYRVIAETAGQVKADLIIMSTNGRGGTAELGSVAERVVRTAPCPVLTMDLRQMPQRRRTPPRQNAGRVRSAQSVEGRRGVTGRWASGDSIA